MNGHVENAKINSVSLGGWDCAVPHADVPLSFALNLDMNGRGISFGGYSLDPNSLMNLVRGVLIALKLHSWEQVPRTLCRVKLAGPRGPVEAIGHIIEDRWFTVEDLKQ